MPDAQSQIHIKPSSGTRGFFPFLSPLTTQSNSRSIPYQQSNLLVIMKLSITSFLVAALVSLASAQSNGTWNFKLRARTYRYATPFLEGYVDVDYDGMAGFGRSGTTFDGFVSVSSPARSLCHARLLKHTDDEIRLRSYIPGRRNPSAIRWSTWLAGTHAYTRPL
jgi:hypothetical protein